jgi:hypothetical protein
MLASTFPCSRAMQPATGMWNSTMADDTDKTQPPENAPGTRPEPFVPGPESGLRNPPSAIERGLKEAADVMHGTDAKPEDKKPESR